MALNFIKTKNSKPFTQRELLIGFCAALVILAGLLFSQEAYGETFWLSLFLFAIFPFLVVVRLLKEPIQNFGLSWGKPRTGLIISLITVLIFIFANYFILFHTKYGGQLSIARGIVGSFTAFLAFEFFISLPLHFFWEFFFRGFLQLGLEKKLGNFSLLLAAVLPAILSFQSSWIMIVLIFLSSIGAGIIVRQSRSIFYSALSLWIISISLDIMIIRIVHQIAK
ncbi:MAG: CPBP family glutamic-type intramembrane protease [Parcubacteria group bacterium]|jgi:membrane protease YdiL (CAAX protease family)